jgi:hypothetical protein
MHCHPRKGTALLCLSGTGCLRVSGQVYTVTARDFLLIGKGVFHSTENVGTTNLDLVEVELPRNKLDLVRYQDNYGRRGEQYEKKKLDHGMYILPPSSLIRGSKLRGVCLENKYTFNLRLGLDVICRPAKGFLFAIAINLTSAINHTIQVFNEERVLDCDLIDIDGLYLTISQNQ